MTGKIVKVSGPLIVAENLADVEMYDVVKVSEQKLIGEVIELRNDRASIQVYEETSGLKVGDPVESTGAPLSVELGPGLIESIFDGIQRPLNVLAEKSGNRIERGVEVNSLDREKAWHFVPAVKKGESVGAGDVLGTVQETNVVLHKIMVPVGVEGKVSFIAAEGDYTVTEKIAEVNGKDVCMMQKWPVRRGRPYKSKMAPDLPMVTGQRVIDTLFPIAKGGVAAVPGPFGSGKTVVQHQLAKWADADIIVYVGCGERGNEMTDVLQEFPHLNDPKTGQPLNMGYTVAIMADSTSRWAEALREMSGRLEEMPGEEGYPAYLSSRLAEFYERAGIVKVLGSGDVTGAISAIGAVSPPGGDLSEPVSQATLRIVKVFWGLSASLAYRRHFPAIDWLTSYSLYDDKLDNWYSENVAEDFNALKGELRIVLQEESQLNEIVRLVGMDALGAKDRLTMETAKSVREDYLHQNAFHEVDTYTSLNKQYLMMKLILGFYHEATEALDNGAELADLLALPVREQIGRAKYIEESHLDRFDEIQRNIKRQISQLVSKGEANV